jgi:hypothetical protein
LLGLRVNNQDALGVDTVHVDSIRVKLLNGADMAILSNPSRYLDVIHLWNNAELTSSSLAKTSIQDQVFANYDLTGAENPEFNIAFDRDMILDPGVEDTLAILATLAGDAPNVSFVFQVTNIYAYVNDQRVSVVDSLGTTFNNSEFGMSSIISILSGSPEDEFTSYPNPFGQNSPQARFVFFLEQPGPVEIKIYTLLGGMVWSDRRENLAGGQVYDGEFIWDGFNNKGQRVLNGVYVAVLKANGKTYITKVAYIK